MGYKMLYFSKSQAISILLKKLFNSNGFLAFLENPGFFLLVRIDLKKFTLKPDDEGVITNPLFTFTFLTILVSIRGFR